MVSSSHVVNVPRRWSDSTSRARGYGPSAASISASSPGVDTWRRSWASPLPPVCQNSGMFQSTRAPTLTGHETLAVFQPARAAASHSVGTRISSAYQYQL